MFAEKYIAFLQKLPGNLTGTSSRCMGASIFLTYVLHI